VDECGGRLVRMESRVELFAQMRRDARVEGLSVRALAARHKVHRRTVRQALESATPPERKPRQAVAWRLEPFKAAIDAMLVQDHGAAEAAPYCPQDPGPADRGTWRGGAVVFDRV
jgi:hypothetical protein